MSETHNPTEKLKEIKSYIDSWKNTETKNLTFERLSGLTNEIWKVSHEINDIEPQTIIYRRFGDPAELIDRESENLIFQELANQGISPKIYGATSAFRIEEFIDFSELDSALVNTPKFRLKIALVLERLHRVKMPNLDQSAMFEKFLSNNEILQKFRAILEIHLNNKDLSQKVQELKTVASTSELDFLKKTLPSEKESLCLSHNDLHNRNMLYSEKSDKLILIDFEYAGYNYKGYDIANLFNESVIDYNVDQPPYYKIDISKFPTDLDLIEFLQYYSIASKLTDQERKVIEKLDENKLKDFVKGKIEEHNLKKEVEILMRNVRVCLMYSHFYWCVWSLIKSSDSKIKFDYVQFACDRYDLYKKFKEIHNSNYASCWSALDYSKSK